MLDNKSDARAAKIAAKEAKQSDKLAKRAAAAEAKEQARAARLASLKALQASQAAEAKAHDEKYGKQMASELIQSGVALRWVTIYDKGYVKVKGNYEKIRGISGDVGINKKTGIGRGVVAIATVGLNLALTSSQRGRIHLTIVTDAQTHSFSTDQVSDSAIKSYQTLLGAGTAIMEMLKQQDESFGSAKNANIDVAEQIRQLSGFLDQGILSETEFAAAKAKLLGTN
jgi:hypothetical protein